MDTGYLAHLGLVMLFGNAAPKPFVLEQDLPFYRRGWGSAGFPEAQRRAADLIVLGYTTAPGAELRAIAADRDTALLSDAAIDSKKMPDQIPAGARFRFTLRACPTVRTRRLGTVDRPTDRRGRPRSREIDAWLARCLEVGTGEGAPAIDRGEVYAGWLTQKVGSAAAIERCRLVAFCRGRLLRRTHRSEHDSARRNRYCERPVAILEGTLSVRDGAAFRELLARGVGRHRAFGFGMLLLRPAR
jgi:CRISPR system Cascade subunit CasE